MANITESINEKISNGVDAIIEFLRLGLTTDSFMRWDVRLGSVGDFAAPITSLVFLLLGTIGAIKCDSFSAFAGSLGVAIGFIIAHQAGRRMRAACDQIVANSSSNISGYGIFSVISVVALAGAIYKIFDGIYYAIKLSSFEPLYSPLALGAVVLFMVWFLLNPSLLRVSEDQDSSPGNDALTLYIVGLVSFVKMHRVLFGAGAVAGNLMMIINAIQIIRDKEFPPDSVLDLLGAKIAMGTALAPLLLYLGYIFAYLALDICRALLRR